MSTATEKRPTRYAPTAGLLLAIVLAPLAGCHSPSEFKFDEAVDHYQAIATELEVPDGQLEGRPEVHEMPAPFTVRDPQPDEYWQLSLQEAIQIALTDSEVIRDLGVRVMNGPSTAVPTVYDPALREADPRTGPEAALSAFDAQFQAGLLFEHNERAFNNILLGGGSFFVTQDTAVFQGEISKKAATGSQFFLRNQTDYNANDARLNRFSDFYTTLFEAEVRQPLLQGAGIQFNRIAGNQALPGTYNGILIARINTDVTLADFEQSVRNLLRDVERTYWDLYFAYRRLDAVKIGRDSALETWRSVQRRLEAGATDHEQEAQARAQYYLFQSQVIEAQSGTMVAAPAETTAGGVYATERKLRSLLGLPANDGRLIRPADNPLKAETVFDWEKSLQDALWRRVELRKQKWQVRRRELELIAAENFTKMRLDMVGKYRFPGFGDDLLGNEDVPNGSAFADLFEGNRREWTLGLQLTSPIGNRIGHAALRHAQWALRREKAIFREQELQISHELSTAFAELARAYATTRSNYNHKIATSQQMDEIRKKYEAGAIPLEFYLTAQRQATQADTTYYRSLIDYNLAVSRVCFARGTLLDYFNVHLSEGPWSEQAHISAQKQARRFRPAHMNYRLTIPPPLSAGAYPQRLSDAEDLSGESVPLPREDDQQP